MNRSIQISLAILFVLSSSVGCSFCRSTYDYTGPVVETGRFEDPNTVDRMGSIFTSDQAVEEVYEDAEVISTEISE